MQFTFFGDSGNVQWSKFVVWTTATTVRHSNVAWSCSNLLMTFLLVTTCLAEHFKEIIVFPFNSRQLMKHSLLSQLLSQLMKHSHSLSSQQKFCLLWLNFKLLIENTSLKAKSWRVPSGGEYPPLGLCQGMYR